MQTTYGKGYRKPERKVTERKKQKEGRQLVQLLLCLVVFLAVFIGKGVWPSKVAQTGAQLLQVIRANTDFRAAFAGLGEALSQQESVLGEIGDFCVSVFAPTHQESDNIHDRSTEKEVLPDASISQPQEEQPAPLQVGDVVQETQAQELPEGYSAQWLYLGDIQTATPVMGTVTSAFGYRDHPTMGRYAAHGGVDIAANLGTEIVAFADGTVAEVGYNEDFGRYLLIDHPHGVSTFYSHCNTVLVQTGEEIRVGQSVAQVGSTGQSTGSHLHFEVRLNGVRLNPMHYVDPGQVV